MWVTYIICSYAWKVLVSLKMKIKVFKNDFRCIWKQKIFVNQGISVGFLLVGWLGEFNLRKSVACDFYHGTHALQDRH